MELLIGDPKTMTLSRYLRMFVTVLAVMYIICTVHMDDEFLLSSFRQFHICFNPAGELTCVSVRFTFGPLRVISFFL